jgi:hypothetical protein
MGHTKVPHDPIKTSHTHSTTTTPTTIEAPETTIEHDMPFDTSDGTAHTIADSAKNKMPSQKRPWFSRPCGSKVCGEDGRQQTQDSLMSGNMKQQPPPQQPQQHQQQEQQNQQQPNRHEWFALGDRASTGHAQQQGDALKLGERAAPMSTGTLVLITEREEDNHNVDLGDV